MFALFRFGYTEPKPNQTKKNFQFKCIWPNGNGDIFYELREKPRKNQQAIKHLLLEPHWISSNLIELEFMDGIHEFGDSMEIIYIGSMENVWSIFATTEHEPNASN